jgi:SecD/SecF fusion protein
VNALLLEAFKERGIPSPQIRVDPIGASKAERYAKMRVEADTSISNTDFVAVLNKVKDEFALQPQPDRLEVFNGQLARDTQQRALWAILASWVAILLYLWFRFGSWTFGAAAVVCLVHDLFFTLGAIAAAHYLHGTWLGNMLALQDFKIDLPSVAALLTLVGYSVSDTIVVFDRIREVRGKNPALTPQMINDSVNQTLSRTVLSAVSVWLVVFVLYVMGGEGVHLFAFVMVVGVIVGTYSSIYIASPLLLIFGEGQSPKGRAMVPPPVETGIKRGETGIQRG